MPDIQQILIDRLRNAMVRGLGPEYAQFHLQVPPTGNTQFGDYQINYAMSEAKKRGENPRVTAQNIVSHFEWSDLCDAQPQIAGPGFINLKLKDEVLDAQVSSLRSDAQLGVDRAKNPQTVVVDYSGCNVAKEMHVGHLRSSIIGDAIVRVLDFQGHRVIRQNHVGDWGTQFGMLIEHMIETQSQGGSGKIGDLNTLYQLAKKRFDDDANFAERAKQRVVKLQGGDEQTLALWRQLVEQSMVHFQEVYSKLGVLLTNDDIRGESFYNPRLNDVITGLKKAGLLKSSEGASVVFPPGFKNEEGDPLPMIVRKSDGGFLYATTDLAAARFRIDQLKAQRVIYVTDSRQAQHFAMVFATVKLAGWAGDNVSLEYVPFGSVLGKDRKPFKTRSGDVLKLLDLLDEAKERAATVLAAKTNDLSDEQKSRIASVVGIGALKYADLSNDRIKDYIFDWDRMLAMDGNTAPYLINAYVRIRSIFRKAATQGISTTNTSPIHLGDPAERALGLKLLQFPSVVQSVAQSLEPHRLCTYLYELASAYHQFYERCPVLTATDAATRDSRLALSDVTARVLSKGLGLLGIEVVEQM